MRPAIAAAANPQTTKGEADGWEERGQAPLRVTDAAWPAHGDGVARSPILAVRTPEGSLEPLLFFFFLRPPPKLFRHRCRFRQRGASTKLGNGQHTQTPRSCPHSRSHQGYISAIVGREGTGHTRTGSACTSSNWGVLEHVSAAAVTSNKPPRWCFMVRPIERWFNCRVATRTSGDDSPSRET